MAQRTAFGFLIELEDAKEKLETFVDQVRKGKVSLIWSPKNGHHEVCYLDLVEGI